MVQKNNIYCMPLWLQSYLNYFHSLVYRTHSMWYFFVFDLSLQDRFDKWENTVFFMSFKVVVQDQYHYSIEPCMWIFLNWFRCWELGTDSKPTYPNIDKFLWSFIGRLSIIYRSVIDHLSLVYRSCLPSFDLF